MKTFYVDCVVKYQDSNDYEPYDEMELYSFIIPSTSINKAKVMAKQRAIEALKKDIGDNYDNVRIHIDNIYETSDDATCD